MKFYSIRVVEAETEEEAIEKLGNPICDKILCNHDAIRVLLEEGGKIANVWSIEDVQIQVNDFNEENGTDLSMSEDEMWNILEDSTGDFEYQTGEINSSIRIEVENILEKNLISDYVEKLLERRNQLYDADGNTNSIAWIDEDMDHLEIGFLDADPDSGYSHELKEKGYRIGFEEALEMAKTRLKNSEI